MNRLLRQQRGLAARAVLLLLAPCFVTISGSSDTFLAPAAAAIATCSPSSDTATAPGYTILSFMNTGTCNWIAPSGISNIDSLVVVAGGGGGAGAYSPSISDGAGAGGGGGVYAASSIAIPDSVTIQVGTGGAGGAASANRYGNNGSQGNPSAFGSITSGGGGGGGCEVVLSSGVTCTTTSMYGGNGTAAGSGGGASNYYNAYNPGGAGTASSATFNGRVFTSQIGYRGGYFNDGGSSIGSAGGPGGGSRGNGNYNTSGTGLTSAITGSNVEYGKGGGAYGVSGWSFRSTTLGYGTGGDGQAGTNGSGAAGAQGIVIVKYKNIPSTSTTVSSENFFFRTSSTISATPNLSGKLTFYANNVRISSCKSMGATAYTAKSCIFRPTFKGLVNLSVTLVPTDSSFSTVNTTIGKYFIKTRNGSR